MSKKIQYSFTPGEFVTVPTDLGYFGPSSKIRSTYQFVEYKDEETRCKLRDLNTGKTSLWSIGWVKPLKIIKKKVASN